MQNTVTAFTPKDILTLGKLIAKNNPALATETLAQYKEVKARALDTNFHNMNFYFLTFCKMQGVDASDLLGDVRVKVKTEIRRQFIAAMIKIFQPHAFTHRIDMDRGIGERLSCALQLTNQSVGELMDEVIVWYNNDYEDYKQKIDDMVSGLIAAKDK